LFLDQWASFCCSSMPDASECGKYLASNGPNAPSAASTSAITTRATAG
jgi:hypothetical protein